MFSASTRPASIGAYLPHALGIKPGVRASFPRPNLDGDWDTNELIALLGGLPPLQAPKEPAWAAFSL
jgi:hypothetical protein